MYNFNPIDIFASPDSQKLAKKGMGKKLIEPEDRDKTQKEFEFFLNEKCLGLGDSKVE